MGTNAKWWLAVGAGLCVGALACGEDEGGGGEATEAEIPEIGVTAEALVTADEGGELRAADFRLEVPAGAVRDDVTLMLEVQSNEGKPEREALRGPVYELGPDGTRFDVPVTLELPIERLPRDNERAEVVWHDLERDRWMPLDGAEVVDGKVRGRTDHFTAFTVRFVLDEEGDVVVTEGLMCGSDFEACGGEVEGTWVFDGVCTDDDFGASQGAEPSADGEFGSDMGTTDPDAAGDAGTVTATDDRGAGADLLNPVLKQSGECVPTDVGGEFTLEISGSITFEDGRTSGMQGISTSGESRVPATCYAEVGGCEEAGLVTDGDDCVYSFEQSGEMVDLTGSYSTDGGSLDLRLDEDPTSESADIEYCVQGDTLTVVSRDSDGFEFRFTAIRR